MAPSSNFDPNCLGVVEQVFAVDRMVPDPFFEMQQGNRLTLIDKRTNVVMAQVNIQMSDHNGDPMDMSSISLGIGSVDTVDFKKFKVAIEVWAEDAPNTVWPPTGATPVDPNATTPWSSPMSDPIADLQNAAQQMKEKAWLDGVLGWLGNHTVQPRMIKAKDPVGYRISILVMGTVHETDTYPDPFSAINQAMMYAYARLKTTNAPPTKPTLFSYEDSLAWLAGDRPW